MNDSQMSEFFGQIGQTRKAEEQEQVERPAKAPRQQAGKAADGKQRSRNGRGKGGSVASDSGQGVERLVQALAKLTLRHEDMRQIQRLDTAWVIFMKTPPESKPEDPSMTRLLMQAARVWKAKTQAKDGEPGAAAGRLPLRTVLGQTMAHAFLEALKRCSAEGQERQRATSNQWLQGGQWVYQKWVPDKGLVGDSDRAPLSMDKALDAAQGLLKGFGSPATLNRFHALRPLTEPLPEVCPFMLDISLREEGCNATYQAMEALRSSSALQMVNIQWRKESLKRSALADQVQNLLGS
jgi:hypothetical protein